MFPGSSAGEEPGNEAGSGSTLHFGLHCIYIYLAKIVTTTAEQSILKLFPLHPSAAP